ncbi:MAG: thermonuclease family protein [Nitrospiraceae bacterium]
MRSLRCLWTVLLTLLLTSSVLATELTGPIVGVLDCDTIEVLNGHHTERIRLSDIDCPEKGQAYGQKAKQVALARVFEKEVTLRIYGKDKYGRTIADVLLLDRTNVNHTLVEESWCWGSVRLHSFCPASHGLSKRTDCDSHA